jgi:dual specificity protein phosphatase-like protein
MLKSRLFLVGILLSCFCAAWLILLALERSYPDLDRDNFSLIEDGLYQGGSVKTPPPGTQAVLNLCEVEDRYICGTDAWEPIKDGAPAPSLEWLEKRVKWVDAQREAGLTTFVHCFAGHSRSGMVVTAYLMYKKGWTRDEALAFVKSKRPLTRPNDAFMELLAEWDKYLKENPHGG